MSNLTGGRATIDVMNEIGYDAAALGNHEFDWGSSDPPGTYAAGSLPDPERQHLREGDGPPPGVGEAVYDPGAGWRTYRGDRSHDAVHAGDDPPGQRGRSRVPLHRRDAQPLHPACPGGGRGLRGRRHARRRLLSRRRGERGALRRRSDGRAGPDDRTVRLRRHGPHSQPRRGQNPGSAGRPVLRQHVRDRAGPNDAPRLRRGRGRAGRDRRRLSG